MKQSKLIFMPLILTILSLALILGGCQEKGDDVIRIGAILPLTGDIAEYGIGCKEGLDLAIEEANRNSSLHWDIEYFDDKGISKEAVTGILALDSKSIDIFVGPVTSSAALSLIPIINTKNKLLISPTASTPELSCKSKLFFRVWPSDNYEAEALANYSIKKLKLSNVFILYVNNDYGIGLKNQFEKTFNSDGGKILGVESYEKNQNSFRQLLTKVKIFEQLQSIYIIGYHKELAQLTKQIRELKINAQLLASANYETPELLDLIDSYANDVIYATPSSDQSDTTISISFQKEFRKKYSKDPNVFSKNSYDIIMILKNLIEKNLVFDPKAISDLIRKLPNYYGVSGTMNFNDCGDVQKPIAIKTVKNGEFILKELISN